MGPVKAEAVAKRVARMASFLLLPLFLSDPFLLFSLLYLFSCSLKLLFCLQSLSFLPGCFLLPLGFLFPASSIYLPFIFPYFDLVIASWLFRNYQPRHFFLTVTAVRSMVGSG